MKSTKTMIIAIFALHLSLPAFAQDAQTTEQPDLTPKQMQFAVEGALSPKIKAVQLDQGAMAIMGAQDKDDLIVRVGVDGTITLYGSQGQGFKAIQHIAPSPGKGVVNKVTVTATKNSPLCHTIEGAGWVIYYPSPPCPLY